MAVKLPPGWHTVTPRLFVDDPAGLVGFLKRIFGATGRFRDDRPSEITIGDSMVMIAGTEARDPMPACLYVYVDDVDAACRRATDEGATAIEPPGDMPWGDRRGIVKDRWGNVWQIATHLRDW